MIRRCIQFAFVTIFFANLVFAEENARRSPESANANMLLERAKDLNLTEDQKKQFEEIKSNFVARCEKLDNDPQLKELNEKARAARESRDEVQMAEIQKGMRERRAALLQGDKPLVDPMTLLTDDQRQQLREMAKFQFQRPGGNGGDDDRLRALPGLAGKLLQCSEELNLSTDQINQLSAIKSARQKIESDPQTRTLFAQLRVSAGTLDDSKIGSIMEQLNARKIELGIEKNLKSPMDILNDVQRRKVAALITERQGGDGERKLEEARREVERRIELLRLNAERDRKPESRRDGEKRDEKTVEAKGDAPPVKVKPNNDE